MDCGGVVYARVPAGGVTKLEEAIKKVRDSGSRQRGPLGVLAHTPGSDFAIVDRWGKSDDMPRWAEGPDLAKATELAALSQEVGEVIGYYAVEDGDQLLIYGHWKAGTLVRVLQRMEEWDDVRGTPEPWEAGLFSADAMAQALQQVEEDGGDVSAVRAELAGGHVKLGAQWPRPSIVGVMRKALNLPIWGFQPWPRRNDVVKQLG